MQNPISTISNALNHVESKYGTLLFYFGISLVWVFNGWYEFTETPMRIYWACGRYVSELYVFLFLLRLLLLAPKYPKYVTGSVFLLAILFICYLHSGNHRPFDIFLAMAAARNCSHRKICFIYWASMLSAIVLSGVFWKLGLASEVLKHLGNFVGHSYGINNPSVLAEMYLCTLFAAILYFKINRFRYTLICCWLLATVVFLITLCRSVTLVLLFFPLLLYFITKQNGNVKGLVYWPICMLLFTIILAYSFGPVLGETTLISRFSIPYYIYEQTGLSWFGDSSNLDPSIYIDNFILHYVLNNGIIVGVFMLLLYSCLLHKVGNRKNHPLLLSMICSLTFLGFFSIIPLDIKRNFMLLFFFNDEEEVG